MPFDVSFHPSRVIFRLFRLFWLVCIGHSSPDDGIFTRLATQVALELQELLVRRAVVVQSEA